MIIAIDIGGTKISVALIDNNNKIIESKKTDSIIHQNLTSLASYVINFCDEWIEKADFVAVACTGQVGTTKVNFLSARQSLPLQKQFEQGFGLPVVILNDAAAAAWAEYCLGPERLDNTLVYITVSTGIGGGIIQNGQLITSNNGFCAHVGHVSVNLPNSPAIDCHCGRVNCAEAISSGTSIARQASKILNKNVTCKQVFEKHLTNPEIIKLIDQCTDAMVDLIATIKAITGTNIVILGGSVGMSPQFKEMIILKVANLPKIYQVNIESPILGAEADLIGAALYAKKL